jgi:hypothetical protein
MKLRTICLIRLEATCRIEMVADPAVVTIDDNGNGLFKELNFR